MRLRHKWLNFNTDPELESGGGEPTESEPESTVEHKWPDNWRELYAGEDEKKLSQLSRYASPEAAFDGLIATKSKLSSGEYKSTAPFPETGTEEEQQAWREQNGIPNDPKGYEFEGIPETEQEFVDAFREYALTKNIPKDQAGAFVDFLKEQNERAEEADKVADETVKQQAEDALRAEWGNDYRRNINMAHGLLDSGPEGLKDLLLNSRDPNGNPLGSSPEVLKFLTDMALQVNPVSTLIPNSGGNIANSLEDEIKAIEAKFGTKEYERDEKMQARLRQLYDAQEKFSKAG